MENRIIKFRAWDVKEKRFCSHLTYDMLDMLEDLTEHSDEYILMQFTGLHDKNGVEIYEGDIMRTPPSVHGYSNIKHVVWDDYKCCFDFFEVFGKGFLNSKDNEVIGNIYQHPDLLSLPAKESEGRG